MVYNISMKTIAENRQVRHEYFIEDSYEAGLCLEGSEVKSIRAGSVNLKDSFCYIRDMEVFVKNMHVAVYDKSAVFYAGFAFETTVYRVVCEHV